jgi:hypothetical protein
VAEKVRVEASQVGLLPVPLLPPPVMSSPGRAWLAARAVPRHVCQVSTWAIGEQFLLFSSSTFFSSMAAVIGHFGHDLLCQAHRLGSVVLLVDACLMIESISC